MSKARAQEGETPADLAKSNRYAEVKRFFASGQVRPIRVQSEVLRGHQRALRGHSEAIRGTHRPSEGSQRPVSGTQRPSEAIRGHSEALTGHQRALRGHPCQSFAISSTQSHSVAIKRAPGPKTATMATSRAERAPCACACARVRSTWRQRSARQKKLSLLQLSLRASPSPPLPHTTPASITACSLRITRQITWQLTSLPRRTKRCRAVPARGDAMLSARSRAREFQHQGDTPASVTRVCGGGGGGGVCVC
jgi:hypothetical protein